MVAEVQALCKLFFARFCVSVLFFFSCLRSLDSNINLMQNAKKRKRKMQEKDSKSKKKDFKF